MAQSSLIKKLRIQPEQRLLILNAPPAYTELLGDLPQGAGSSEKPDGAYDFVHLFVTNSKALPLFDEALAAWRVSGKEEQILGARWSVVRCLRSLERHENARIILRDLEAEPGARLTVTPLRRWRKISHP